MTRSTAERGEFRVDKTDGRSLRSGFLRSAASTPNAPALTVQGVSRSYGELERTARVWAQGIVGNLGRPAERVGVFGYRSEVSYAGVLAALFSGAAFVPLNRTFPPERTRLMIHFADLDAIIVDESSTPQLLSVVTGLDKCPLLILPDLVSSRACGVEAQVLSAAELSRLTPLHTLPPVASGDLAYLLFTSGSTGQPKGVPVTHANALHFIDVVVSRYQITPRDRFSQTFEQTFDLSVFDLFVAWERGACVCAMQPLDLLAPVRFVANHGITIWFSVPSIPALMRKKGLLKPNSFPTIRWSLFCGEPLPQTTAQHWLEAAPHSIVENLYGPTELTVACTVHRWDPEHSPELCVNGAVPIGRPYPDLGVVVVNDNLEAVSDGESGELCVCGPQTTPGYWRDATKTSERYVSLPVSSAFCQRFYRTGDRVKRLPGGEYIYLGRVDQQIKVLGHRVELEEIEAALRRNSRVVQAVALGWPMEGGTALGITAFVSGADIDRQQIKEEVRASLPDYMCPREILVLDPMPLSANGKIDRNALRRHLESLENLHPVGE